MLKWLSEVGGLYKSFTMIFGVVIGLLLAIEEKNTMASIDPDYKKKVSVESIINQKSTVDSLKAKVDGLEA